VALRERGAHARAFRRRQRHNGNGPVAQNKNGVAFHAVPLLSLCCVAVAPARRVQVDIL
jgi:hypothetical protein